jgi:hypothetical protein
MLPGGHHLGSLTGKGRRKYALKSRDNGGIMVPLRGENQDNNFSTGDQKALYHFSLQFARVGFALFGCRAFSVSGAS